MRNLVLAIATSLTLAVDGVFGLCIAGALGAISESSRCLTPIFRAERALDASRAILILLVLFLAIVAHVFRGSTTRYVQAVTFIAWGVGAAMLVVEQVVWRVR